MDGPLKEFAKLEKLSNYSSGLSFGKGGQIKTKTVSTQESLDSLLRTLHEVRSRIVGGAVEHAELAALRAAVEERKKEVDERQKEIHSSLNRYGKALDKKLNVSLPPSPALFNTEATRAALERTIALHFLRTGQFSVAETFLQESHADIPHETRSKFVMLHEVLTALRNQDIKPALAWCEDNRAFLQSRSSSLEFSLHRSQYIRLLLAINPPDPLPALGYARKFFPPLYPTYTQEANRLLSCIMYLPLSRLQRSPYADLASPSLHLDLVPMFAKEYCASLGMSRQVPLRVVGDIGGGGALARIEKGKKLMRESKRDWSSANELPIEIPLPPENRYHSIFACPVSKEQSTPANPPMMMVCGHVVVNDSLLKLYKPAPQGKVKCPYCPQETAAGSALQVHF